MCIGCVVLWGIGCCLLNGIVWFFLWGVGCCCEIGLNVCIFGRGCELLFMFGFMVWYGLLGCEVEYELYGVVSMFFEFWVG